MQLYEWEAKELLRKEGMVVPAGVVCCDQASLERLVQQDPNRSWVAKCQIRAGDRDRAGGIQLQIKGEELLAFGRRWLGRALVTSQTSPEGESVRALLVEPWVETERCYYVSLCVVSHQSLVRLMVSDVAGRSVEEGFLLEPERYWSVDLLDASGIAEHAAWQLGEQLGIQANRLPLWVMEIERLIAIFFRYDLLCLEINPLAISSDRFVAIDAKVVLDNNGLSRQPWLQRLLLRRTAYPWFSESLSPNLVCFDGAIACIANGAGLAMAMLDAVIESGGTPSGFLDVGGGSTWFELFYHLEMLFSKHSTQALLLFLRYRGNPAPLVAWFEGYGAIEAKAYMDQQSDRRIAVEQTHQASVALAIAWSGV